jgi:hypothetical protein
VRDLSITAVQPKMIALLPMNERYLRWYSPWLLVFADTTARRRLPSEVENGAAGEAATWTGRPEAERTGSERIKSRSVTVRLLRGIP